MSTTTLDSPTLNSYLKKYIAEETKNVLEEDGIVLQEKISLGKTGRITYHGVKGNFRGGQFMSRSIYMEIRKQQGIIQRIGSGIKEIYLKFLQKTNLYKLRPSIKKAAERIANFFRTRGASMLSRTGPGAMKAGAIAKTFVMKIGSILGSALGAVPGIGWAALGATAAGMLIYKYYFDDGPGGIAKETLAGAGKKTSKYRAELDKIFEKAFVEKAGFFSSLFGGEDDYSMVKKTRGESPEQLLRRLKGSDKLSDEEKERAEELMALIAQVQIATRIQQVGKKLKEFPNMDPNQVYGQVVGGLDPATGGNKPKPKPKPKPGRGSKAARQRALAKKIGMSIADIQNKLVNYFKKGSNTFSVKENKGAGINPDGKYGGETEQAIKDFQNEFNGYVDAKRIKAKKLTPDGLFGPATLAAVKMVEQDKDLYALSKLNPKYSNKGTQVAGRGAAGLPGGEKEAVKIFSTAIKFDANSNKYLATVETTDGKQFEGEHPKSGSDDEGDQELAKSQARDRANAYIKSLTKESKRGKTTINKTKLINIIKEEIESVLSESIPQGMKLMDYLNQNTNPGEYGTPAGKNVTKAMAAKVKAIVNAKDKPNDPLHANFPKGVGAGASEDARRMFWGAIKHHFGGKVPYLATGEYYGITSRGGAPKNKLGDDAQAAAEKGKPAPAGDPDPKSRFNVKPSDPKTRAKVESNRKRQMRITSPNKLKYVQRLLIKFNYLPAVIQGRRQDDGDYGLNTMQAIEKFQNAMVEAGLMKPEYAPGKSNVDGLAGRRTIAALRKYGSQLRKLTGL